MHLQSVCIILTSLTIAIVYWSQYTRYQHRLNRYEKLFHAVVVIIVVAVVVEIVVVIVVIVVAEKK